MGNAMMAMLLVSAVALVPMVGGTYGALARVRLHGQYSIAGLFAIQALCRGRLIQSALLDEWAVACWSACSLALLFLLWSNRGIGGLSLVIAGLLANLSVVLINDAMPVFAAVDAVAESSSGFYLPLTEGTSAVLFSDVLPDPLGTGLLSIGDVLLGIGAFTCILRCSLEHHQSPFPGCLKEVRGVASSLVPLTPHD